MTKLAGRRILVTRPSHQAGALVQAIAAAGGVPLLHPLLHISPAANPARLSAQLAQLPAFQWLIFVSANAVEFGLAALRQAGQSVRQRVVAVGAGTARALAAHGVTNVLQPAERFDSEGVLALPELQAVAGQHVLIFRGNGGRELLGDTLTERGATVAYAECYQRSLPARLEVNWAAVDAVTVTSSEALQHLDSLVPATVRALPLFVPHARIATLAQQRGWQQVFPTASGDAGLLVALQNWVAASEVCLP